MGDPPPQSGAAALRFGLHLRSVPRNKLQGTGEPDRQARHPTHRYRRSMSTDIPPNTDLIVYLR